MKLFERDSVSSPPFELKFIEKTSSSEHVYAVDRNSGTGWVLALVGIGSMAVFGWQWYMAMPQTGLLFLIPTLGGLLLTFYGAFRLSESREIHLDSRKNFVTLVRRSAIGSLTKSCSITELQLAMGQVNYINRRESNYYYLAVAVENTRMSLCVAKKASIFRQYVESLPDPLRRKPIVNEGYKVAWAP